jgi:hypothetical protein
MLFPPKHAPAAYPIKFEKHELLALLPAPKPIKLDTHESEAF